MHQIYVSIDLEMTSARPESQEVLEIALVKFRGATVLDTWSTLVNPQCAIPYSIQVLTSIRQEDVNRAPLFYQVAGDLLRFIKDYPLVAHTVTADVKCLQRSGLSINNPLIDTYELATILLPNLPSYSLEAVATHLGVSFRTTHRAADDALTQKEVFIALIKRAEEIDLAIIQEINRLVANSTWPLKDIFLEIERRKSRTAFSGTSIRQQLAAKEGIEAAALDFAFVASEPDEPLVPKAKQTPIDKNALKAMLEPGGFFASSFPDYEYRPQQTLMLEAVVDALNDGHQLIVEAGTGTGKSIAYLLPAIYFSVLNSERIVVSTNTINLQDQLFNKDIPTLQQILPIPFRAALVKGRGNYLCLSRWAALRRHHNIQQEEIATLVKILIWLPSTETGDVSELSRLTDDDTKVWHKISAAAENCDGKQCIFFRKGTCFLFRARRKAESSNIVIVNHALLLSDLASDSVLPTFRYLIIDEAHHLEDEATEQFGFSVSQSDIDDILNNLTRRSDDRQIGLLSSFKNHLRGSNVPAHVQKDIESRTAKLAIDVENARTQLAALFNLLTMFLTEHSKEAQGYEARLLLTPGIRRQPAWERIEIAFDNASICFRRICEGLNTLMSTLAELEDYKILDYDTLMGDLNRCARYLDAVIQNSQYVITSPQRDGIYWIANNAHNGVSLHSAPLHVGEMLQSQLYSTKESVIFTSATLSAGKRFDYIKERIGAPDADELIVDSPFDYSRSTMLYLPTDIPEPEKPFYQKCLQQAVIDVCAAAQGRTLVLFTSHSQLRATWRAIRQPLEAQGILVLGHKIDGTSRRQLLQTFKSNAKTVLLGTASFWEGIDVVGDALSVLIIARLPFSVPTDPIFAARSNLFHDPFVEYSLPQTILRFKQGFGRLIRSHRDHGVVIVLDSRISTKQYGKVFLESLPACTIRRGPLDRAAAETAKWLSCRA